MSVPGLNILSMALRVIGSSNFQYYKYLGRSSNAIGLEVTDYAEPACLSGSVQPVPRELYDKFHLQFQKNYMTFFVQKSILDVKRDVSSDKIVFNGKQYKCESVTDWYAIDGWVPVLAVQVDNAG